MKRIGERDIHTLRTMEERFEELLLLLNFLENSKGPQNSEGSEDSESSEDSEGPEEIELMMLSKDDYFALRHLFSEVEYWRRAWVVQGLACAPRVLLLCEDAELDWQVMSTFLRDRPYAGAFYNSFGLRHIAHKIIEETLIYPLQIEHQRWISQEFLLPLTQRAESVQRSTLFRVLARFRDRKSSDPRDKVYAFLGLAWENHGIVVDYTKSVEELFRDVTVSIINSSRNLDIICQNPFEPQDPDHLVDPSLKLPSSSASSKPDGTRLPTWVADLRLDGIDVLFAQRNIFNAGKTSCEVPCRLVGQRGQILVLKGCIIDRIGTILQDQSSSASTHEVMLMYLGRHVLDGAQLPSYKGTSIQGQNGESRLPEPALRAFWRTILKDCTKSPRIRRLTENEIEVLGTMNESTLLSKELDKKLLYSHRSSMEPMASAVSPEEFPYLDEDGELAIQFGQFMLSLKVLSGLVQSKDLEARYFDHRFMFVTSENGLFVKTRKHPREGDAIVVLDGAKVPVLLREVPKADIQEGTEIERTYQVVGPAYVHGLDGWRG